MPKHNISRLYKTKDTPENREREKNLPFSNAMNQNSKTAAEHRSCDSPCDFIA